MQDSTYITHLFLIKIKSIGKRSWLRWWFSYGGHFPMCYETHHGTALNSIGPKTKYTYESISLMGWWCYPLHVYTTNMPSYRTHAYTFIHNLTRTRMYVHVQVSERLEALIGYHVQYLHHVVPRLTRVSVKQHSPHPPPPPLAHRWLASAVWVMDTIKQGLHSYWSVSNHPRPLTVKRRTGPHSIKT